MSFLVFILPIDFFFMYGFILVFPILSFQTVIPKNIFYFLDSTGTSKSNEDPRFRMILWLIIAGTRGGINRARILNLIRETPTNANKIANILKLDHKTVMHHIEILSKHELIIKDDKDYGATYNLTQIMKNNQNVLAEIMEKIGTK
jgi:DNA-binding transcriptional ArsR family regulator